MRASELPDKWQLVLDALSLGDIELAHRLAIKYEFDQNKQIQKSGRKSGYTYFAKDAEGKIHSSTNSAELSRRIGKATSYVTVMIRKQKGRPVSRGDLKGWVFWKEA